MEYPETLTVTITKEHWMRGREAEEREERPSQSCALAQALRESEIGPVFGGTGYTRFLTQDSGPDYKAMDPYFCSSLTLAFDEGDDDWGHRNLPMTLTFERMAHGQ